MSDPEKPYGVNTVAMQASPNFEETLKSLVGVKNGLAMVTAEFGGGPKIKKTTPGETVLELEDGSKFVFRLYVRTMKLIPGQRGPSGEPVYSFDLDVKMEQAPSAKSMSASDEPRPERLS